MFQRSVWSGRRRAIRIRAARLAWRVIRVAGRIAAGIGLASAVWPSAVYAARPRVYAIQGARIVVSPGKVISTGTVVIRDGMIEAVGSELAAPADAEIVDGKGLTVYAGLIDPFTRLGIPKSAEGNSERGRETEKTDPAKAERPAERGPGRPNALVRSDVRAALLYQAPAPAELEKMRRLGFTSAAVVPEGGAFRGTSALVHLGSPAGDDPGRAALVADSAAHLSLDTAQGNAYPASLMGVISLIRQTFEDARTNAVWKDRWTKNPKGLERPPFSPALDAVGEILGGKRRCVFEADDTHAYGRIAAIASEFSFSPVVVGNGFEYEVLEEIKKDRFSLLLPVAFPEAPHLEDEDAALDVKTRDLRRWDLAPGNPAALQKAGIPFALTTYRLKNAADFRKNVIAAIDRGLSPDAALEAVTVAPARLLGVESILGTVEAGKIADLVLADGDLFAEKTQLKKVFIDGGPVEIEEESKDFDPNAKVDPRGTWELTYAVGGQSVTRTWKIEGAPGSYAGTGETQAGKVPLAGLSLTGNKLTGSYTAGGYGTVEFTWIVKGDEVTGSLLMPSGSKVSLSGKRTSKPEGGVL